MNAWILVPCGFGLWWLASGLSALGLLSASSGVALVFGAAAVAACGFAQRGRNGIINRRAFRFSVLAESVGIALVLLTCSSIRRPDLIMPLVGAVVGLHFVPLAGAFNDRRFIFAACLLTGVCLASLLWSPPVRMAIAGIGAGAVLWAFALWTSLPQGHGGKPPTLQS
jgi:hypothetical protein